MANALMFKDLVEALQNVGLKKGDLVFVHSDLRPFGKPEGCEEREPILNFYWKAFQEVLGPEGTIAVPAYFYEYARLGEPFDERLSPVSKPLGVFSSFIASLPERVRSLNPLQSIAAVGPLAEGLCKSSSLAGYGVTSPWHRLRDLRGKILFLGTTIQPMTYVHHIEQQFGVPHLYTKIYPYPVISNGVPIQGTVTSSVRYLEYGIEYQLEYFQKVLTDQGLLNTYSLHGAPLYLIGAEDAFQAGIAQLLQNPYCFLKTPPSFIEGKIPTDGITGKKR